MFAIMRGRELVLVFETLDKASSFYKTLDKRQHTIFEMTEIILPTPPKPGVGIEGDNVTFNTSTKNYVFEGVEYTNLRSLFSVLSRVPGDLDIRKLIELPRVTADWERENR